MANFFESIFYWNDSTSLLSSLFRFCILVFGSLWYEIHSADFVLLSLKRCIVVCLVSSVIVMLMIWNHIGFVLDDIFFPEWKLQKICKPVFIVGNARSGTTWLHRCLTSLDTTKYTTFRTWELIFAPAVTWKIMFLRCYSVDQYFGSPIFRLINALESTLIGESQLHAVGLQLAEEDEWLMTHVSLAQLMCFFFPCGPAAVFTPLIMFDAQPSDAHPIANSLKMNLFDYYKQCVKRHLYASAIRMPRSSSEDIVFVSKNPAFTLRLETLYRTFPDCRVICMLRDPVQSIPSMVSYLAKVYHLFSTPRIVHPNAKELLGYCILHYQFPLEHLNTDKHPANQWAFVKYSDLQRNLAITLTKLLSRLDIYEPDCMAAGSFYNSSLKRQLEFEQSKTKRYKSTHVHSVHECCKMDEAELKSLLKVVYDTHKF